MRDRPIRPQASQTTRRPTRWLWLQWLETRARNSSLSLLPLVDFTVRLLRGPFKTKRWYQVSSCPLFFTKGLAEENTENLLFYFGLGTPICFKPPTHLHPLLHMRPNTLIPLLLLQGITITSPWAIPRENASQFLEWER
jgi:hypothetical protein